MTQTTTFKGRPALAGNAAGSATVSKAGFNATASFMDVLFKNANSGICQDHSNQDLYGLDLANAILCVPKTIGSSAAACMYMLIVERGIAPKAMLFSESIDSIAACGLIMADNWSDGDRIITVDGLGQAFLDTVKTGDQIDITADGTVTVYA